MEQEITRQDIENIFRKYNFIISEIDMKLSVGLILFKYETPKGTHYSKKAVECGSYLFDDLADLESQIRRDVEYAANMPRLFKFYTRLFKFYTFNKDMTGKHKYLLRCATHINYYSDSTEFSELTQKEMVELLTRSSTAPGVTQYFIQDVKALAFYNINED